MKESYQPSKTEIKQAEDMVPDEYKKSDEAREEGYELAESKENKKSPTEEEIREFLNQHPEMLKVFEEEMSEIAEQVENLDKEYLSTKNENKIEWGDMTFVTFGTTMIGFMLGTGIAVATKNEGTIPILGATITGLLGPILFKLTEKFQDWRGYKKERKQNLSRGKIFQGIKF